MAAIEVVIKCVCIRRFRMGLFPPEQPRTVLFEPGARTTIRGNYWETELIPQLKSCILQTLQAVQSNMVQRFLCRIRNTDRSAILLYGMLGWSTVLLVLLF